jgi:hypothetical protein
MLKSTVDCLCATPASKSRQGYLKAMLYVGLGVRKGSRSSLLRSLQLLLLLLVVPVPVSAAG